jgi:hypothetical protein
LSSAMYSVAGRLVFPAPSSTFSRCRPGPRGFPGSIALVGSCARQAARMNSPRVALLIFYLSFRALVAPAGTPRSFRRSREFLLSWDSPACCPSTVRPSARPLPGAEAPFGPTVPTVNRVPPSWFLTTSAVCSALGLRVCCTPLPAMEFDAFLASGIPAHPKVAWMFVAFPAPRVHTLRRVPLVSSRIASLRPLPSCLFCTFSLPGPARPWGRAMAPVPSAEASGSEPCTCAGRSLC